MTVDTRGDLTAGAPGRKLLEFALPILIINLLQAVYNVADMVILGQVTGAAGMSAVGTAGQVTNVVLVIVVAVANGGAAMMGGHFGRGRYGEIRRLLSTMLGFVLIAALVLTVLVIAACRPILRFLNTPDESFAGAVQIVQMVLTNTSFLLMNGLINVFDVDHSAAAAAVTKIWNLTVLAGQALMAAMISMTAQNLAKGEYRRILRALYTGCAAAAAIGGVFTLLCELIPGFMLSLFTKESPVIAAGISYLRYFAIGFMAENVMFCLFGTLTGSGHTLVPMCCAIVTSYLVRYLFTLVLSRYSPLGFDGIAIAYSLAPFISAGICTCYIAGGRWK